LLKSVLLHNPVKERALLRDPEENPEAFTAGLLQFLVQRRVLPKPPTVPGLELAAAMQTTRLLGGDDYDLFQTSDDVVDVVIADVSGKGAAASLLMPSLAVVLRLRARQLSGPRRSLEYSYCAPVRRRPNTLRPRLRAKPASPTE
jgi:serine phosphatase RsbU (regulator of sigma subunit)